MKVNEILALVKAGYTKDEIAAMHDEPAAQPAQPAEPAAQPAQPAEPAAQPAQPAEPAAQPAEPAQPAQPAEPAPMANADVVLSTLQQFEQQLQALTASVQRNNIVTIGTEPQPSASAEEILTAQIIAPRT